MNGLARNSSRQDPGDASACPEPSEPALVNYYNENIRIRILCMVLKFLVPYIYSILSPITAYVYSNRRQEKKHEFSFLRFFAQIC